MSSALFLSWFKIQPATATYMLVADGDQTYWTGQEFVSDGTGLLGYAYLN